MTDARAAVSGLPMSRRCGAFTVVFLGVVALAAIVATTAAAQSAPTTDPERVRWLQQHAAPVRSTDPADEDYADLAPLGAAIGSARIVMLGEQTHGDGTTFLAKTRVIKYLHERLGFDVLAFESGLYDVPKAWTFLKGGEDAATAARRGVFGTWSRAAQVQPLFEYVARQAGSARPLELTGFDLQFTGSASKEFFRADLRNFLARQRIDTALVQGWAGMTPLLDDVVANAWYEQKLPKSTLAQFMASWTDLRRRVERTDVRDTSAAYWKQLLKSTGELAQYQFIEKSAATRADTMAAGGLSSRDVQMADNLLWLAREKYPERKIVVWAATYHIIKNPEGSNTGPGDLLVERDGVTMGQVISATLREKAYAIGFIASEGAFAPTTTRAPMPVPTPQAGSLDALFAETAYDNAFLDLRSLPASGAWLREPMAASPLGYHAYTADWTRVLDGVIYTRRMTPKTAAMPRSPAPHE